MKVNTDGAQQAFNNENFNVVLSNCAGKSDRTQIVLEIVYTTVHARW